jgi:hypothetical protein
MNEASEQMIWTPDKLIGLYQKLYECVHDEGMSDDDVFTFDGHEFVVGYAIYLSLYLSNEFSKRVK